MSFRYVAKSYNDASKQHKAVLKLFQSLNKNMGSIDTEEVKGAEVSEEQAKLLKQVQKETDIFVKDLDVLKTMLKGMRKFVDSQQASSSSK